MTAIVGREAELTVLDRLLGPEGSAQVLVLTGGPGIGKTTLWDAAVELGRERGRRVLAARASGADTRLSFATLIDLFDGIGDAELSALPPPQRRALEVALYRAEPTDTPPEPHAIALGVLNVLRSLAPHQPLLVAVDDVQWLDRASEDALAFAARRLGAEPVSFLLAAPAGPALGPRARARSEGAGTSRAETAEPGCDPPHPLRAPRPDPAAPPAPPGVRLDSRQSALRPGARPQGGRGRAACDRRGPPRSRCRRGSAGDARRRVARLGAPCAARGGAEPDLASRAAGPARRTRTRSTPPSSRDARRRRRPRSCLAPVAGRRGAPPVATGRAP